jgi:hypothetical protein
MVQRSNVVIVADHLTVAVEKEDPWPLRISHIETAGDRDLRIHGNGKVKGILWARGGIFAGIEDEH